MNWMMNGSYQNWHGWPAWTGIFPLLFILSLVDIALRGYSMWYAAKRSQKGWFIALLVINSLGIVPLIYLFINKDKKKK